MPTILSESGKKKCASSAKYSKDFFSHTPVHPFIPKTPPPMYNKNYWDYILILFIIMLNNMTFRIASV